MNIKKEMSPLEIVELYPQTDPLFRIYDERIGKCLLCHCLFEPLEDIAREYDLDLAEMMTLLEKGTETGQDGQVNPSRN